MMPPIIVLVEDDRDIALMVPLMLSDTGLEFETVTKDFERCSTVEWWVKLAHERGIRGVICDFMLPGEVDGIDITAAAAAALDGAVPIVLFSAHMSVAAGKRAHDRVTRLQKPSSVEQIRAALNLPATRMDGFGD